jgi:hypothetical protein
LVKTILDEAEIIQLENVVKQPHRPVVRPLYNGALVSEIAFICDRHKLITQHPKEK